jgi:hypothetical protein
VDALLIFTFLVYETCELRSFNQIADFFLVKLSLSLSLSLPSLLSLDLFLFVHFLILLCSWVSNGVVGSPAFAAYDQGMYVVTFDLKLSEVAVIHYD